MCRALLSARLLPQTKSHSAAPFATRCLSTICRFNQTTNASFEGPVGDWNRQMSTFDHRRTPTESRTLDVIGISVAQFVYIHLPDVCVTHTHTPARNSWFEDGLNNFTQNSFSLVVKPIQCIIIIIIIAIFVSSCCIVIVLNLLQPL